MVIKLEAIQRWYIPTAPIVCLADSAMKPVMNCTPLCTVSESTWLMHGCGDRLSVLHNCWCLVHEWLLTFHGMHTGIHMSTYVCTVRFNNTIIHTSVT